MNVASALQHQVMMAHLVTTPLAGQVIGAAIAVHRALGPGLLESVYARCLALELTHLGIPFLEQVAVPLVYRDVPIVCGYRADFLVAGELLVELKAAEYLLPIHSAQVLTYLRLLDLRKGLLINFNVVRLVEGIKSIVN